MSTAKEERILSEMCYLELQWLEAHEGEPREKVMERLIHEAFVQATGGDEEASQPLPSPGVGDERSVVLEAAAALEWPVTAYTIHCMTGVGTHAIARYLATAKWPSQKQSRQVYWLPQEKA